ncbi:MAG: hypothetical protein AB2556_22365, partial [Candidatus Thiodiazotropha sp.]
MLAYAHINLLSMLRGFEPEEAVRVATDSIYISRKWHSISPRGSNHMWLPGDATVGGTCACPVYSRR